MENHMRNYLRMYRRKTDLTIGDISHLLNLGDGSTLSKYEKGLRKPSLEIIVIYHLIFDIPLDRLLENEKRLVMGKIKKNVKPLIHILEKQSLGKKVGPRISFLNSFYKSMKKKHE